ncbi:unnamed protein product [Periconia digitata]|uniref:Uncharacterized protein n=1 Tax=Periconia digitata TaxID=1303443 RepID=A0A9W4UTY9_9PLEO|nr:unnamed protein product [Periconia digitata]
MGLGTAARSMPSRVLRIALVALSSISSSKSSWSMERPALEKRLRILWCSSLDSSPRWLANVAEYAISMEMAWPWRRGTEGESCSLYQLCSSAKVRLTHFVERAPCVTIGDDTVQTNLVKVRSLQLQHLVDASTVDLICSLTDFLGSIIGTTKACLNQLLAVLVK